MTHHEWNIFGQGCCCGALVMIVIAWAFFNWMLSPMIVKMVEDILDRPRRTPNDKQEEHPVLLTEEAIDTLRQLDRGISSLVMEIATEFARCRIQQTSEALPLRVEQSDVRSAAKTVLYSLGHAGLTRSLQESLERVKQSLGLES